MFWSISLCFSFVLSSQHSIRAETTQERLVGFLFKNYDRSLRPVHNVRTTTKVKLNPAIHSIVDTDEAEESITFVQWFRMIWVDEFLHWNSTDFDGMDELLIPISRIWLPDITIDNLIESKLMVQDDKNYAIIASNGTVLISYHQVVNMYCSFHENIVDFPFDTHNCSMHVASWMHSREQIDTYPTIPTDLAQYQKHAEWDLISFTSRRSLVTYFESVLPFVEIYYDIVIQRKPSYYLTTFVLPSFIITTLAIIGIFAPFSDAGGRQEKVTMGLTTLLTMAVILNIVTDLMPTSSDGVPLLELYLILQILISAIAALTSVFMMCLHSQWTKNEPIPDWLLRITNFCHQPLTYKLKPENGLSAYEPTYPDKVIEKAIRKGDKTRQLSLELRTMVSPILTMLDKREQQQGIHQLWNRACRRLDILFMIAFNVLHVALTVGFLGLGYAKLKWKRHANI
uniref:Uncharacterized protein n=1 Tax=Plectus sambesii TaxID=2011161 RepID=A0A914UIH7_9BILA